MALALKLQGKDEELTNLFEDLYFVVSSEGNQHAYETTFLAFTNLMTHYCHFNPSRVMMELRMSKN